MIIIPNMNHLSNNQMNNIAEKYEFIFPPENLEKNIIFQAAASRFDLSSSSISQDPRIFSLKGLMEVG